MITEEWRLRQIHHGSLSLNSDGRSRTMTTAMKTVTVRIGSHHECRACGRVMEKGSVAAKRFRRAETYQERCHADSKGNVNWYYHTDCFREVGR